VDILAHENLAAADEAASAAPTLGHDQRGRREEPKADEAGAFHHLAASAGTGLGASGGALV
jgi:hypothetical protein